MKKSTSLFSIGAIVLMASCSQKTQIEEIKEFEVISPIVVDTVYTQEYVAEITAFQNVEIRSRIRGFIENIYVDEGQTVQKGQTLFTVSNKEYQQNLLKAKAEGKSAAADLKAAEIELENSKILLDKKIIGKPEHDLAVAKVEAMKAKLEGALSDEAQASLNLSFTEIKAPFDGTINRIPNKTGSLVEEGTLLTTISNNKEVFAYYHVSENDYLDYVLNKSENDISEVSLLLANGMTYEHNGKIDAVESQFDAGTGSIAFRAKFPNPDKLLKHGANGKIVKTKELKNALIIPQKSTFEIQDQIYVYVVNQDSILEQRNIKVKMRFTHLFVLESGLAKDEIILYEGVQSASTGDKISFNLKK